MTVRIRLKDVPLFKFVDADDTEEFAKFTKIQEKNAGDVILVAGEVPLGIYIVAHGNVGVFKENVEKPVARIGFGGALGEMSLIESKPASATIRAIDDSQIIFIHKDKFVASLKDNPRLAIAFYRGVSTMLSLRLRETTQKISKEFAKELELKTQLRDYDNMGEVAEKSCAIIREMVAGQKELQKSLALRLKEVQEMTSGKAADALGKLRTELDDKHAKSSRNLEILEKQVEALGNVMSSVDQILSQVKP